jgi:hypothetical protein
MTLAGKDLRNAPHQREYFNLQDKAAAGDIVWVCTPATVAPAPTSAAWTRDVVVTLETAAGEIHTWFNKAITTGVSVGDTSTAGTATIASTTLTVVNGKAVVTVSGDAADWLDTETDTLTVAQATILGATVAAKTSVETFTAP